MNGSGEAAEERNIWYEGVVVRAPNSHYVVILDTIPVSTLHARGSLNLQFFHNAAWVDVHVHSSNTDGWERAGITERKKYSREGI